MEVSRLRNLKVWCLGAKVKVGFSIWVFSWSLRFVWFIQGSYHGSFRAALGVLGLGLDFSM